MRSSEATSFPRFLLVSGNWEKAQCLSAAISTSEYIHSSLSHSPAIFFSVSIHFSFSAIQRLRNSLGTSIEWRENRGKASRPSLAPPLFGFEVLTKETAKKCIHVQFIHKKMPLQLKIKNVSRKNSPEFISKWKKK